MTVVHLNVKISTKLGLHFMTLPAYVCSFSEKNVIIYSDVNVNTLSAYQDVETRKYTISAQARGYGEEGA